ncbi:radical SAM protein [Methanobrevibacter sp. DSM 116169]|uniref:SPL family radical SAM protein n=1 Tax=Methanobrevibacter sp. DSM 116169 TaxID=3242727 RepID=UPI0038FD1D22
MNYKEIKCKSALNNLKRKMPYAYDLNIYRGCNHSCKYCYALYSHKYLNSSDYYNDIFVKSNIDEVLKKELKTNRNLFAIGTVTDSYQEAEKHCKIMPKILKILLRYKNPIIISTKSDLILRDYDLISELSNKTFVNIASSIITCDDDLRSLIEPNTSSIKNRFKFLKEFKKTNTRIGLHIMPILPYITDSYDNLENLFKMASKIGVNYVLPGQLNLYGETKIQYFNFLKKEFPQEYLKTKELFKEKELRISYKKDLFYKLNNLKDSFNLSFNYKPDYEKDKQSTLF